MHDSIWDDVFAACDELANLVKRHEAGENRGALSQALGLCRRMRGPSSYTNGRIVEIERLLKCYFSAKPCPDYQHAVRSVRSDIVYKLERIRTETTNRKAASDE